MARLAWALLVVAVAVAGCGREKDPLKVMKPPQLVDEAERRVAAGDLAGAEKVYRMALDRYDANAVEPVVQIRHALFHLAMKRDDLKAAQAIYKQLGSAADYRAANNLAVATFRKEQRDEARALGEHAARAMARGPAGDLDRIQHMATWMTIDRLRTARFDRDAAMEAADAVFTLLRQHAAYTGTGYRPIPGALRPWIVRYQEFLFASDRDALAKQLGDIVERIDQNAPPGPDDLPCLPLYAGGLANLGCLMDIEG